MNKPFRKVFPELQKWLSETTFQLLWWKSSKYITLQVWFLLWGHCTQDQCVGATCRSEPTPSCAWWWGGKGSMGWRSWDQALPACGQGPAPGATWPALKMWFSYNRVTLSNKLHFHKSTSTHFHNKFCTGLNILESPGFASMRPWVHSPALQQKISK